MTAGNPGRLIGPDYTDVAGAPASATQLERLCNRYYWAAEYVAGRTVLEVACGTGQGLGLLARSARSVTGGDHSWENLSIARRTYGGRIPLIRLDGHVLPVADASVDVVLLLEALYFLPKPDEFLAEAARVLRPGGQLLVSAINKDCWDFNPSPLYPNHLGVVEVAGMLERHGLAARCYGAIPLDRPSARARFFRPIKAAAVTLNLIPRSMQARVWLKRIVFGKLVQLPFEITPSSAPYRRPVPLPSGEPDQVHQVVLAAGLKSPAAGAAN